MRKKLKENKFIILAIFLMAGVSVAGWAFAFHYENKAKGAGLQKELKSDLQAANEMPSTLDHSKIILLLVSTGLIGYVGVRRKGNPLKTFARDNRSKIRLRINLLTKDNLESQKCGLWKKGCVPS